MRFSNYPLLDKRGMAVFVYVVPLFLIRTHKITLFSSIAQSRTVCIHTYYICMHVHTYVRTVYVCVMVRGRKLGGSKSTVGLHSRYSPATLM